MTKDYTISEDLLQETVNFLARRPYEDVFKIVPRLTELRPNPEPEVDPKETPSD